jgi:hypothetical protein
MISNREPNLRPLYGAPIAKRYAKQPTKRKTPDSLDDSFFDRQREEPATKKRKTVHDSSSEKARLPHVPADSPMANLENKTTPVDGKIKKRPSRAHRARRKRLEDPDRIHYDTVKLVHQPAYAAASGGLNRSLEKIVNYDSIEDYKKKTEKAKNTSGSLSGDRKLEMIKFWLDNLGLKRHHHQIRFHEHMIKACLSKIYEEEWETQYEQITHKFGIEKMKREGLYTCPRRFGKTTAVAIYCAAFLLVVPNSKVAVFATGKRTAKKLMMQIVGFLIKYPGFLDRVKTKNQEDLILDFGISDERMLSCYPSTVKVRRFFSSFFFLFFRIEGTYHVSNAQNIRKIGKEVGIYLSISRLVGFKKIFVKNLG